MSNQEPKLHEILLYLCDKENVLTFKERLLATFWLVIAVAVLAWSLYGLHDVYTEWAANLTRTSYSAYSEFWATIFSREGRNLTNHLLNVAFFINVNACVIMSFTYIRLAIPNILKFKSQKG